MSLSHNDLVGTVLSHITLDEFEPKSGDNDEVVVIGLYAIDYEPAQDLNTFIQRGTIDIIDTEVSPNPDQHGNYVVFVEIKRDELFPKKTMDLLVDVENLVGKCAWTATMSNSPEKLPLDDLLLKKVADKIPDTKEVTDGDSRAEIKIEESELYDFLKGSLAGGLTIDDGCVILEHRLNRVGGKIVAIGDGTTLLRKHGLENAPIDLDYSSTEVAYLRRILGESFEVLNLSKNVVIRKIGSDEILILSETQIING